MNNSGLIEYKPHYWLIDDQDYGHYSLRRVQVILGQALAQSGVNPYATVHTLRHTFATHLLGQGLDLRYIQTLLGHFSTKTTETYIHITQSAARKIRSPLNLLDILVLRNIFVNKQSTMSFTHLINNTLNVLPAISYMENMRDRCGNWDVVGNGR